VDLLLVDSGDLHDGKWLRFVNDSYQLKGDIGTGLTDGFPPGGVDAHDVCLNPRYFLAQLFTSSIGQ